MTILKVELQLFLNYVDKFVNKKYICSNDIEFLTDLSSQIVIKQNNHEIRHSERNFCTSKKKRTAFFLVGNLSNYNFGHLLQKMVSFTDFAQTAETVLSLKVNAVLEFDRIHFIRECQVNNYSFGHLFCKMVSFTDFHQTAERLLLSK